MMAVVIYRDSNSRVQPRKTRHIDVVAAQAGVDRGELIYRGNRTYEEVAPKSEAPEDLDSVVDEEPAQTYVTRDMQAEAKPEPARRRRGRPRKKTVQASDGND